jgi:hypothetical protein
MQARHWQHSNGSFCFAEHQQNTFTLDKLLETRNKRDTVVVPPATGLKLPFRG